MMVSENEEREQPLKRATEQAWTSHGEGTQVQIPRTITVHIVRTLLLTEEEREEFDEEIKHVPIYQLEATVVRWMLRRLAPTDWIDGGNGEGDTD